MGAEIVLTRWNCSKCPLEFRQRQINGIVFDIPSEAINSLQEYVYFAKIARYALVITTNVILAMSRKVRARILPAPKFDDD